MEEYLMVTDGAGGVDLELGLRSTLPHAIGEHSLRGGATADVPCERPSRSETPMTVE